VADLRPAGGVAVHPSEENNVHEFYLMCDDVDTFVSEMKAAASSAAGPVHGWGG
jgi:hypothetical protein